MFDEQVKVGVAVTGGGAEQQVGVQVPEFGVDECSWLWLQVGEVDVGSETWRQDRPEFGGGVVGVAENQPEEGVVWLAVRFLGCHTAHHTDGF